MKRIMGIDYGDARTGVAISDLLCSIVGTTMVVPSRNREKAIADLVRIAKENDVYFHEGIVSLYGPNYKVVKENLKYVYDDISENSPLPELILLHLLMY